MRTAHSSPYGRLPDKDPPWTENPQKEHGTGQPDRKWHHTETPATHASENIILRQSSCAGGNECFESCMVDKLIWRLLLPSEADKKW